MAIIDPTTALVCLILLGFFVIILNISALLITISSGKRKRSINYPLLWLLLANILIGFFPLPIYGLKKFEFTEISISSKVCDAWRYTYFTAIHLAMVSLSIMTFDKLIVLTYPLRYRHIVNKVRLNMVLASSWVFFIIFDMIPFFPLNEHDDENCHYVVKKTWAVAMNVLTMAIPLPLIVMCYSYMHYIAYKQAVRIRRDTGRNKRRASTVDNIKLAIEIKATRKVAYIVGSYITCWAPSALYYLLEWLCKECYPKNYQPHKTWIRFFFKLLVLFHGFTTPVLFCWNSKNFRKDVVALLRNIGRNKMRSPEFADNKLSMFSVSSVYVWGKRNKRNGKSKEITNNTCTSIADSDDENRVSPKEQNLIFSELPTTGAVDNFHGEIAHKKNKSLPTADTEMYLM